MGLLQDEDSYDQVCVGSVGKCGAGLGLVRSTEGIESNATGAMEVNVKKRVRG